MIMAVKGSTSIRAQIERNSPPSQGDPFPSISLSLTKVKDVLTCRGALIELPDELVRAALCLAALALQPRPKRVDDGAAELTSGLVRSAFASRLAVQPPPSPCPDRVDGGAAASTV